MKFARTIIYGNLHAHAVEHARKRMVGLSAIGAVEGLCHKIRVHHESNAVGTGSRTAQMSSADKEGTTFEGECPQQCLRFIRKNGVGLEIMRHIGLQSCHVINEGVTMQLG